METSIEDDVREGEGAGRSSYLLRGIRVRVMRLRIRFRRARVRVPVWDRVPVRVIIIRVRVPVRPAIWHFLSRRSHRWQGTSASIDWGSG